MSDKAARLLAPVSVSPVASFAGLPGLTDDESGASSSSSSPAISRSPSFNHDYPTPTSDNSTSPQNILSSLELRDIKLTLPSLPETPRSPLRPSEHDHLRTRDDLGRKEAQPVQRALFGPSRQQLAFSAPPQQPPAARPNWKRDPQHQSARYVRRLGPTESSYYLATRGQGDESGVNDMYLHIGFKAAPSLMTPSHLLDIWTELTLRHPLLASTVEYRKPEEVYFVHNQPASRQDARNRAGALMALVAQHDHKNLLDDYLNGPRTLAYNRLSFLVISSPEPQSQLDSAQEPVQYHFMLFCTHFVGDGMALHATANEFFQLLTAKAEDSPSFLASAALDAQRDLLHFHDLPDAVEVSLKAPQRASKLSWAAACTDFITSQRRQIGGHALKRRCLGPRETVVPTVAIDSAKTKAMLASCKANGTTISNAVVSLANAAYIRANPDLDPRSPMLFYSAMSIRSTLEAKKRQVLSSLPQDHFRIAISYYNIVLPSFFPKTAGQDVFWSRCHSVKQQTTRAVKSPFLQSRAIMTAVEREHRSIGFALEDELKAQQCPRPIGLGLEIHASTQKTAAERPMTPPPPPSKTLEKVPSTALMGLSMLGNLDGVYTHKAYNGVQLDSLTTGSRQRPGALLLFAYTFAGKLWFSLGYDRNGFEQGTIEAFWTQFLKAADEFLL
ncbi:hypothetical protein ACM66B_000830 [Microbotryomycetes sp. NB124-2]